MTTCRTPWAAVAVFLAVAAGAWSQQGRPVVPSTSGLPSAWTWSIEPLQDLTPTQSSGGWAVSLPKLLSKGWDQLMEHHVSVAEHQAFWRQSVDSKILELKRQHDQKALERSRLRLGTNPDGAEVAKLDQGLLDLDSQLEEMARKAATPEEQEARIALKHRENLDNTKETSSALYQIRGTLRTLSGYLQCALVLFSSVEDRELSRWEGTFAPEEASVQMVLARQKFLEIMLGRPWAAIEVTSEVAGTVVDLGARGRRSLPWLSEDLDPGPLRLTILRPGRSPESLTVDLEARSVRQVRLGAPEVAGETIKLLTSPPDASVWLDSRWLGHSPLEFEVPLQVSRLRYQLDGYASGVVEVGPQSPRLLDLTLALPGPLVDPTAKRDQFYWSLAAVTAASTATFFLRDAADQQLRLTNAYAKAGNATTYAPALETLTVLWYGSQASIALTTGVFVWMMFTLGDYLAAAQTQLP